jgi:hypothetical protein
MCRIIQTKTHWVKFDDVFGEIWAEENWWRIRNCENEPYLLSFFVPDFLVPNFATGVVEK